MHSQASKFLSEKDINYVKFCNTVMSGWLLNAIYSKGTYIDLKILSISKGYQYRSKNAILI